MFPWIYEFKWTAGHIVFLGVFFSVAFIIAATLVRALQRVWDIFNRHAEDAVMWESAFEGISHRSRPCRHELSGEVEHRTCENGFGCGECSGHRKFIEEAAKQNMLPVISCGNIAQISGLSVPMDRYYHRGHTWARRESDGTVVIGLDDFARRVVGNLATRELPKLGTKLRVNGTAWNLGNGKTLVRVLSPIEGEVIGIGKEGDDWILRVKPTSGINGFVHLLRGQELRPWYLRELERLQNSLGDDIVGSSLADGGALVADIPKACPHADWDAVWGEMFMQP